MLHDSGLGEEAMRRFTPVVVAISSETRETTDVTPVIAAITKVQSQWASVTVIDRLDVCNWFVQSVTDPHCAPTVAEVRQQLPTAPDGPVLIDPFLVAICAKHRVIAVAVDRETKLRAAVAAKERAQWDLVAQLVEDGMTEAEAIVEARRELASEPPSDEDEEPPVLRDLVVLKGFPNSVLELTCLDKVGLFPSIVFLVNSAARFGRRDDIGADRDARGGVKKRPDVRKPETKKGRSRDDVERAEPLSVQLSKELSKLDAFEASPLREVLLWTLETSCIDGPLSEDGSKTFLLRESELQVCERVLKALAGFVEKVHRYRTWLSPQSFTRVPRMKLRDAQAEVRLQPPQPVPVPPTSKPLKKGRARVELEPVKEEAPVAPPPPELPFRTSSLPTGLSTFDAEMSLLGSGAKAVAMAATVASGRGMGTSSSGNPSTEQDLTDQERSVCRLIDDILDRENASLRKIGKGVVSEQHQLELNFVSSATLQAADSYLNCWFPKSSRVSCDDQAIGSKPHNGLLELGDAASVVSDILRCAGMSELEGFQWDFDGSSLSITAAPNPRASCRYGRTWTLLHGRIPFPVWAAMEDVYMLERQHYFPPMTDDEPPVEEEEEEEEEELDDDGNPIPRKPKHFEITRRNFSDEAAQLHQRRCVFEMIQRFLEVKPREVLQATNHTATIVDDAATQLYSDDGCVITTHVSVLNTKSVVCFAHHTESSLCFGFSAQVQPPAPSDFGTQTSGIRVTAAFDSLRVVAESTIPDFAPSVASSPTKFEPTPEQTPTSQKRINTPRSKAASQQPALVAGQVPIEDPLTPRQPTSMPPVPPRTTVTCMDGDTSLLLDHDQTTIYVEPFTMSIYTGLANGSVQNTRETFKTVIFAGSDRALTLVGDTCRAKFFPDGAAAVLRQDIWLITNTRGERRVIGNGLVARAPAVLTATNTLNGGIQIITRDDNVEIVCKGSFSTVKFPGNISATTSTSNDRVEFFVRGVHAVMSQEENSSVLTMPSTTRVVRSSTSVVISQDERDFRIAVDFCGHAMTVIPSAERFQTSGSHFYHMDCLFGGLRAHDQSRAFHVTPHGRCRSIPITAEEALTPSDTTVRNTMDVFVERAEAICEHFAALGRRAGFDIESSLHVSRRLPPVAGDIRTALTATRRILEAVPPLPKSQFAGEKIATVHQKLSTMEASYVRGSPWVPRSFFFFKENLFGANVTPSGLRTMCRLVLRQREPKGTDIVAIATRHGLVSHVILPRGSDHTQGSVRCLVHRFLSLQGARTGDDWPALTDVEAHTLDNLPPVLRYQLQPDLCSMLPTTATAPTVAIPPRRTWCTEVSGLHGSLRSLQATETSFWSSEKGRQTKVEPLKVIPRHPTQAAADTPRVRQAAPIVPRVTHSVAPPAAPPLFVNPQPPAVTTTTPRHKTLLVASPHALELGTITEGYRYGARVSLTNVSRGMVRFRASCASPWVSVVYPMLPLAAGMTCTLTIEVNGAQTAGPIKGDICVAHEGGLLMIPVTGECLLAGNRVAVPQSDFVHLIGPV